MSLCPASAEPVATAGPEAPASGFSVDAPSLAHLVREHGGTLPWDRPLRFQVQAELGAGANGHIFSMYDLDLDRPLAAKQLSATTDSADDLASFVNEARVTASMQHPNVPPIHDIGIDHQGHVYFTMNRIEGRSAEDAIGSSQPGSRDAAIADASKVVSIAIGVCSALAFAHHRGIVHQDVKPSNIMLGTFGEVLLIDWGSAIRVADPNERTRLYGTPLYMSPEQAQLLGSDQRSDVYCLGAALFHMLLLRPPTMAWDEDELWRKKRAGTIDEVTAEERSATPLALLAIVLKALSPLPSDRYAAADSMLEDLRNYQAGLAVTARSESLRERLARWYRFNRTTFWLSSAFCAIIGVAVSLLAIEKAKDRSAWQEVYRNDLTHATLATLADSWRESHRSFDNQAFTQMPLDPSHLACDGLGVILNGGDGFTDLSYRDDLLGSIRVEWDYRCDAGNLNFNCFIGGTDRMSGYTFHVGGWDNPYYVALTRGPTYEIIDCDYLTTPMAKGKTYRFVMEQDGGRLRFWIDGTVIFDIENPSDVYGSRSNAFGFDSVSRIGMRISNILVLKKPMAQKVSPLVVADKMLQIPDYRRAADNYRDISESYPGTSLATTALFRHAVCLLRMGDDAGGRVLLERFIQEHRSDEATPYALFELIHAGVDRGDTKEVRRLLDACDHWKGHPVLSRVIGEIARGHLGELSLLPVEKPGDPIFNQSAPRDIVATIHELQGMGSRYGTTWWKNSYAFSSGDVLLHFGRHRDILDLYPPKSYVYCDALLRLCRYQEVIDSAPAGSTQLGNALWDAGRWREVTVDAGFKPWLVWNVLVTEDPASLIADPGLIPLMRARSLMLTGRYGQVLAEYPNEKDAAFDALKHLGRFGEIDLSELSPFEKARVLVDSGQYDELIRRYPSDYDQLYRVALARLAAGRKAEAKSLLDVLATCQVNQNEWLAIFPHILFRDVLRLLEHESDDPRTALREVIAHPPIMGEQTALYLARFVAGDIGEAEFRSQPNHCQLDRKLLFAQALHADVRSNAPLALESYRRLSASLGYEYAFAEFDREFVAWRMTVLGSSRTAP